MVRVVETEVVVVMEEEEVVVVAKVVVVMVARAVVVMVVRVVVVMVVVGITMAKVAARKLNATHQNAAMSRAYPSDGTPTFGRDCSFDVHILNCLREKHVGCRIGCSSSHCAILKWTFGATWKAISMTSACHCDCCGCTVTYDHFVCCGDSCLNCVSSTSTSTSNGT